MKDIYQITDPLRSAIVILDDLQKQIAEIPKAEDRKENLLKEMITINISAAENSLLGANMFLVNVDTMDEATLQSTIDFTKALINKLTQQQF